MPALARPSADLVATHLPASTNGGSALVVRSVDGGEWDRVVARFDGVCQEQLHAFAAVRWPTAKLEARLFELNGRLVGGCLVMVQTLGIASVAIVKWGPVLARLDAGNPALVGAMVDALRREFADQRNMYFSVMPHAVPEGADVLSGVLKARGYARGFALPFPDRYLVRLRLSDEAQRKSLGQTWRRQLNKAEKAGLSFERAEADQLDALKALYAAMSERKQFPDYSAFTTIDRLMEMDEPVRPALFFVRHDGDIVAGALIFKAGDRAVYLYGATSDAALPLRAGYFLHWHIIGWLRDHTRANWYDLGGTDGFSGLHQFKKGMVGDAGVIRPIPPVMNYASRPLALIFGGGALKLREIVNMVRGRIDGLRASGAKPDMPPGSVEDRPS
jgi:hypothetical protein